MTRVLICGASLWLIVAATPSLAGSPYGDPLTDRRFANPAASGVPNVPDLQGCVKWCERDLNPCDPPLFKRADGRCKIFD